MPDNPEHQEQVHQIIEAMDKGDKETVCQVSHAHPELYDTKSKSGMLLLHWAAYGGDKDLAELLLAKGADVNTKDNDGHTPLHWAARDGYKEVAELLLAKRAKVNAKANYGFTPLPWAVAGRHDNVAELLHADGSRNESGRGQKKRRLGLRVSLTSNSYTDIRYAIRREQNGYLLANCSRIGCPELFETFSSIRNRICRRRTKCNNERRTEGRHCCTQSRSL
jgi:ankyrin repeat protein